MLALELKGRPRELELVDRTQSALDYLHHLYEEVRGYAAPIKLDRQTCDVAQVWRGAWSHLRLLREEKQIELCEETSGLKLRCDVDWFTIGQVFRSVLENAIDACPDPGRIGICCSGVTLDGPPALMVTVRDNGSGFDHESSRKVFDAFFHQGQRHRSWNGNCASDC